MSEINYSHLPSPHTKTSIIGFVRYSCWAGYRGKKFADFFEPKYLDYRLDIFKNVTLKSFQDQSDKEFNVFLLHSESLPEKYKDVFKSLEASNGFLHNIYISDSEIIEGNLKNIIAAQSMEYVNFCNDVSINFRIDNDDALPCDFISRLKNYLKPDFKNHIISIPKIFYLQRLNRNEYIIQETYFPSNSAGLAYVTGKYNYSTIIGLGKHYKLNINFPLILPHGNGGIQTINGRNVINDISYMRKYVKKDFSTLMLFLNENNYPDINFSCLRICKRNIFQLIIAIIKRAIIWLKK